MRTVSHAAAEGRFPAIRGCRIRRRQPALPWLVVAAVLLFTPLQAADPAEGDSVAKVVPVSAVALEQQWGVKLLGIRLSAAGYMLDFRYRVLDPSKAGLLFDAQIKPCLTDEATGAKMMVLSPPKIGALRSSAKTVLPDRNYFILFANPAQYIKAGNRVTVEIGPFKVEHLVVQP